MKRLTGKIIYYILTGAPKTQYAPDIIEELISEGANVYVIPTKASLNFINIKKLKKIKGALVKLDWEKEIQLPKEDAVLVAPCTFNTLNKIAIGIADTYPLCLITSAIGNGSPIFIAPAMNKSLWNNFITKNSIEKLEYAGCKIIWPEINKDKVTMMQKEKILDTLYFNFQRINFNHIQNQNVQLNQLLGGLSFKIFSRFSRNWTIFRFEKNEFAHSGMYEC